MSTPHTQRILRHHKPHLFSRRHRSKRPRLSTANYKRSPLATMMHSQLDQSAVPSPTDSGWGETPESDFNNEFCDAEPSDVSSHQSVLRKGDIVSSTKNLAERVKAEAEQSIENAKAEAKLEVEEAQEKALKLGMELYGELRDARAMYDLCVSD